MAGQIRINPEVLADRAKTYGNAATTVDQVLEQLRVLQSELESEWEGQAFAKYTQQYEALRPKVEQFANLLRDINGQLDHTANAMSQSDVALSQNFGLNA